jgi:hypothetical protein
MGKIGNLTLRGATGAKYAFDVYTFDTEFPALGGIYYISNRIPKANRGGAHVHIFVGQAGDLSRRFDDHRQEHGFRENGANCISVHLDEDANSRLRKEADLIDAYHPICNEWAQIS